MKYKTFYKGFVGGKSTLLITSEFGNRTINGVKRFHTGIDIAAAEGTELLSPVDGKIIKKAVQKNGAGLYLTIQHEVSSGTYIYVLLMHLHSVESHIRIGSIVRAGEKIGTTGGKVGDPNAGSSTGPHLHLEVRKGGNIRGNAVDPKYRFLAKHTLTIKKSGKTIYEASDEEFFTGDKIVGQQTNSEPVDDTVEENATDLPPKQKRVVANERLAPGIWQIIKILIDESVADKQVLDSGISTQIGPLANYFRKICQEPMVEFMGDTFGNQYYWIVRKPPFDKEGFIKMIDLTLIPLESSQIISTDLSWNNQGIYSWYQYSPYANLLGIKEATQITPAVFFPEYAAIWGSKPLCVESNYFNFILSGRFNDDKKENSENEDRIFRNAIRDLKYLIESNAYNPFTRRGTITLVGDRRIKRGTVVSLPETGEVFHVDSVSNSYNVTSNGVNRTTTLQVSKGMFLDYIYGKKIRKDSSVEVSYFNLIDFGKDFDVEKITTKNWRDYLSSWCVNLSSFGFFLAKQQMREMVDVHTNRNWYDDLDFEMNVFREKTPKKSF